MLRIKFIKKIGSVISLSTYRKIIGFIRYYILGLFKRMDENNLFFAGAGISFSLFLGMIPFILFAFSVLGNIFDQSVIETQLSNLIDQAIPYPAYANYVKRIIISRLPEVIQYKTMAGFIGAAGLLFTSTWIFSSIRTILNQIFHVKIIKGYLYGLFRDVLMVVLLLFLISFTTFMYPAVKLFYEVTKYYPEIQHLTASPVWNLAIYILSLGLMFIMFFLLYYLIPYEQLGKKVPLISAFWATLLWEVARNVFRYYINTTLNGNPLYGAFVLILAILLWVFYSACLFIVGAEIGQLFRERHPEVN
jgi:membrane protein